jgi:hypothetical protein
MNFPPFWAKGECKRFSCWGWSNNSLAEAQAAGRANAQRAMSRSEANEMVKHHYGYGDDRPLREPVLREFKDAAGERLAVITRNYYGCQVLNTAQIMFVDVDLPEPPGQPSGLGNLFKSLFGGGKTSPPPAKPDSEQEALLAKARNIASRQAGWGWRVYRTRAGFRLLATHQLFDPAQTSSDPLFDELGADKLYRRLCKAQKCFRARLTPKPWRCNAGQPPCVWPWTDTEAKLRFEKWEARYLQASQAFATCDLLAALGHTPPDPAIAPIIAVHDEMTRVGSRLPLA